MQFITFDGIEKANYRDVEDGDAKSWIPPRWDRQTAEFFVWLFLLRMPTD